MENPVGRPTVMTPEILAKLEEAFLNGANDKEAIFIANIGSSTFYEYCQNNPDFAERKEALKDVPKYTAKKNIINRLNNGDVSVSQWYAERKIKDEFSSRNELTGKDGQDLPTPIITLNRDGISGNNSVQENSSTEKTN